MAGIEIIYMIRSKLSLALIIFLGLILLAGLAYFLVYRKFLAGRRRPGPRQLILRSLLLIYLLMVVVATLIDRSPMGIRELNLHLFSSYREAWNQWSLRGWQYQILNIMMFIPLGFLLALALPSFRSLRKVFWACLGASLFIESSQFILARGIFELDDIFNNLLGGLLGYSLFLALDYFLGEGDFRRGLLALLPLTSLILGFFTVLKIYENKELGNLYIDPNYSYNMKGIELVSQLEPSRQRERGQIYRLQAYSREEALDLAQRIFSSLGLAREDLEIIESQTTSIYKAGDYSIWIDRKDRSFTIRNFSVEAGEDAGGPAEDQAYEILAEYGLDIEEPMEYRLEDGLAILSPLATNGREGLLEGEIRLDSYQGQVFRLESSLASYDSYREAELRSEYEAWQDLTRGRFNYPLEAFERMELVDILEDYILDSKGYYQPVYRMLLKLDGEDGEIYIRRVKDS